MEDWRADRVGSALAGTNPTVMRRLTGSFAVIGDVQFLPGYSIAITDGLRVEAVLAGSGSGSPPEPPSRGQQQPVPPQQVLSSSMSSPPPRIVETLSRGRRAGP